MSKTSQRSTYPALPRLALVGSLWTFLAFGPAGCPGGPSSASDARGWDAQCGPGDSTELPEGRLVVATEQYGSGGGITVIDLETIAPDINVALTSDDVTVRWWDGRLWVLNRYGGDNLTLLDGQDFRLIRQISLRPGEGLRCNPQDLAFLSACKVYVTCLDQAFVTILDPSAPLSERFQGEVDLSSLADADALPELSHMAHLGGRVYLSVERLDRLTSWGPVAPSYVAILDPGLDVLEDAIALEGTNPLGPLRPIPGSSELVAAMAGPWDGTGAGLEIIRTQDRTSSLVIGAVELGGIPTAFTLDSGGCGFALVTEPGSFDTGVVRFCLDGRISDCLPLGLLEASDVAVDARGRLWVTDRRILAPGVRLYDAASCAELTSEAIPTGFAPGFTNPLLLVPRTAEAAGAQ